MPGDLCMSCRVLCALAWMSTHSVADELLLCDLKSDCVHRVDAETGEYLGYLVRPGDGGIEKPHSMTIGPDGHLYLANW